MVGDETRVGENEKRETPRGQVLHDDQVSLTEDDYADSGFQSPHAPLRHQAGADDIEERQPGGRVGTGARGPAGRVVVEEARKYGNATNSSNYNTTGLETQTGFLNPNADEVDRAPAGRANAPGPATVTPFSASTASTTLARAVGKGAGVDKHLGLEASCSYATPFLPAGSAGGHRKDPRDHEDKSSNTKGRRTLLQDFDNEMEKEAVEPSVRHAAAGGAAGQAISTRSSSKGGITIKKKTDPDEAGGSSSAQQVDHTQHTSAASSSSAEDPRKDARTNTSSSSEDFLMASADLHHCSKRQVKKRASNAMSKQLNGKQMQTGVDPSKSEPFGGDRSRKMSIVSHETASTDGTGEEDDQFPPVDGNVTVGKIHTAPPTLGRKRSFSISMFPGSMGRINQLTGAHHGSGPGGGSGARAAIGRRMSLSTGHHARASTTIDLGAVVEFSRFSFDQFEIRDTDTDSVNPTATQLYGKLPTHLSVFWRAGHSDLLLFGRKLCSILMLYNAIFTTFYLGFFYPLAGDKTKKWSDNLLEVFVFDMVAEFAFVIFELLFPLRTSIVEIQEGREYVEPADIRRILFRKTAYWANWLTLLGNLLWVDAMSQSGKRTACSWFGLLRLLRYETVRRDRAAASQGGVVISPYRQGVWAGAELVFMMFLLVHLFAVAWFYVLYDTDQETTYEADVKHISVWKFYILALRDAVLLFSASPPTSMTDRDDSSVVLCITMLRPIGAFAEAVIFARIVLIEQRMMILKSKTLEQQAAINAAMTQIKLPPNLHKRINMYHQFLEVQHDKQACDLLYNTSSKALVLEIKICLFASLIEKAPFFRDLHPAGVAEILDNFAEEVFSPGDYIIRFGQEGFEMYFILRGLCDVVVIRRNSMPGPNGIPTARNKLVVAQKREGDYFGETALVQKGQKRTAYVRAQTYTVAEKLTADALNNIVKKKYPDAYNQIVYRISQFHQIAPTPEPEVLNTMHQQQLGLGLPQRGPGAGQPGGVGGGPLAGGSATMLDGVMEHGGGDNLGSTVLDNSASFMVQSEPLRRSTRDAEDAMIRASLATARGGPLQSMALRHSVDPFAAPALASQGIRTTVNTTVGGGPLGGVSSSASNVNFPAIPASVSHQSATLGGGMVPSGRSSTGTSVAGSTFDDGGAGVVGGMISSAGTVVHSATPAHLLVNSNSALQQGQGTLSSSSSSSSAPFAQAAASGSGSGASASSAQPLPPASSLVGGSDAHQPRSGSFAGPLRPSSSFVGSAASAAGLVVASSSSSAAGTATASGDRGTTPAGGPSSPPPHEQIVLQNLLSESHIRGSSDLYSTSDFLRHQQMQSSQEQQEQMQFSGSSRSFTGAVDGVTRVSEKIGLQLKKVLSSASGRNRSPNSTTEDGAGGNGVVPTAGGGAVMSGAIGSLGPGPGG